jgi:hypothetical protein
VTSQLGIPAKRQRFGLKAASHEWWIQQIKDTPGPKYTELWIHLPKYHLLPLKASAELDYQVLFFLLKEHLITQITWRKVIR